jgi:hypothetical protein
MKHEIPPFIERRDFVSHFRGAAETHTEVTAKIRRIRRAGKATPARDDQ